MKLAMFPGQGSQTVGMGKNLVEEFPYTKTIFEEAEDAAKLSIRKICFEGPEDVLKLTANQQPCILTVSIAMWKVLTEESGFSPELFCGHSLGEYSALVASGRLSLSNAARLVHERGQAMQEAVPEGKGAMAAIMGMKAEELLTECQKALESTGGACEIVNYNGESQLIVSGAAKAVHTLVETLKTQKIRCVPLPVSAPFHSSLMEPAKLAMEPKLKAVGIDTDGSTGKIIANLTGKIADPYEIDMLIQQIDSPVLWTQTLDTALESGAECLVEVGPGKVLFSLARRSPAKSRKLLNSTDMKSLIETIRGA